MTKLIELIQNDASIDDILADLKVNKVNKNYIQMQDKHGNTAIRCAMEKKRHRVIFKLHQMFFELLKENGAIEKFEREIDQEWLKDCEKTCKELYDATFSKRDTFSKCDDKFIKKTALQILLTCL